MMKHTVKLVTLASLLVLGTTALQAHESEGASTQAHGMMEQDANGMMNMMEHMNQMSQMMERCNQMMTKMEQNHVQPGTDEGASTPQ